MLEKLITDLKKNLPAPLNKLFGGEAPSEESSNESEEESGDESSSGGDDAKKKKTMIIRVVVILALGYFAVDEFLLKEEAPTEVSVSGADEKLAAKRKLRKKKMEEAKAKAKAEEEAKALAAKAETPIEAPVEAPVTNETVSTIKEEPISTTEQAPPVENINVTPKTEEVISSETVKPEPLDEKLDKLYQSVPPISEPGPEIAINPSVEEIKVPSIGEEAPKKIEDKADSTENKMTSKIVEELVETPPPNYEQTGRGLVYNCKDKFWACVDKPTYVTCNKNMKYNQKTGKAIECSTVAIYANNEDCEQIQKYNVSVNQSTIFCGN